jgi:hypothetical protein
MNLNHKRGGGVLRASVASSRSRRRGKFLPRGLPGHSSFRHFSKRWFKKAAADTCWGAEGTQDVDSFYHPLIFGVFFFFRCVEAGGESTLFLDLDLPSDLSFRHFPKSGSKSGGILGERTEDAVFDLGETRRRRITWRPRRTGARSSTES